MQQLLREAWNGPLTDKEVSEIFKSYCPTVARITYDEQQEATRKIIRTLYAARFEKSTGFTEQEKEAIVAAEVRKEVMMESLLRTTRGLKHALDQEDTHVGFSS